MVFFLGRDPETSEKVMYKSKDLTTHGLIFGMTGSGKTGLAVGMLEEAQRLQIPIIAIDPKGDLSNIALAWPGLETEHFARWMDSDESDPSARLAQAESVANLWRNGLAGDSLSGNDIAQMRKNARVAVYTPGSTAGIPVSLLDRFSPPPGYDQLPPEAQNELISGITSALLSLVKIDADPLQSRESILLTNILTRAWAAGETLDLYALIQRASDPPFSHLGVFEIDEFFPPRARRAFAMQLNNLIASPSFKTWLEGDSLDIDRFFSRDTGASQTSIFSLAHLDDAERSSFVTLLLERIIAWMRSQPGTSQLRAILYMDEVFGYLPPHPLNPPTKRPIMTLLKQARAFGLGVLLATQNPVDLDYKALTNAGTWCIGKLQAERDKERVLDGLMSSEGAQGLTRSDISRSISALKTREFLIQNAHASGQQTFKTKFCMAYLRGPMTRQEIEALKDADFYNDPVHRASQPAPSQPAPSQPAPSQPAPSQPAPTTGEVVDLSPPPSQVAPPPSSGTPASSSDLPLLPSRYLPAAVLDRPELQRLLAQLPTDPHGPPKRWPALFAELALPVQVPGMRPLGAESAPTTLSLIATPLPPDLNASGQHALHWQPLTTLRAAELAEQAPSFAVDMAPPAWLTNPRSLATVKSALNQAQLPPLTIPVSPTLKRYGHVGEALDAFRRRLTETLNLAASQKLGEKSHMRDLQSGAFDREIAEMRELLTMDQRELTFLRDQGEFEKLEKARIRVQVRMEQYKKLLDRRTKFVTLADREVADVEFAVMDHLAACEERRLPLEAHGAGLIFLGVLWLPAP